MALAEPYLNKIAQVQLRSKFTTLSFPPGLMIINDKIINWSWGERPTAVEITSKSIAKNYGDYFLEVWDKLK